MSQPLSDRERQAQHFRAIQMRLLYLLALMVIAGLGSIFYAQVILKVPEKELTQFWYVEIMLITSFVGVVGWAFGTSISSSKSNDTMRSMIDSQQPKSE